jgi:hypothetical protein
MLASLYDRADRFEGTDELRDAFVAALGDKRPTIDGSPEGQNDPLTL